MNNPKFSKVDHKEFTKEVKRRVNEFFKTHEISKKGNWEMKLKSVVMISMFVVPLLLISMGVASTVWSVVALYILSGCGMIGIGMGVMHDANHGSYSKRTWVNRTLSTVLNLTGASSKMWHIQHNVLHHTYTNIEASDDDLNAPLFLRFSPHKKKYWIHRYQHLYVWFFYGLTTLNWVTVKDFSRFAEYHKLGLTGKQKAFFAISEMALWKVAYFSYALVLPMIFAPVAWYWVLIGFVTGHFVAGFVTSVVFQVAHVMPDMDFPLANQENEMEKGWFAHQLDNTTNFSPKSRIFSWYIGGLNYQVEHHLFPNICHVHYRKISKLVKETAEEYGLPYNSKQTFLDAINAHAKMLKMLGAPQVNPA